MLRKHWVPTGYINCLLIYKAFVASMKERLDHNFSRDFSLEPRASTSGKFPLLYKTLRFGKCKRFQVVVGIYFISITLQTSGERYLKCFWSILQKLGFGSAYDSLGWHSSIVFFQLRRIAWPELVYSNFFTEIIEIPELEIFLKFDLDLDSLVVLLELGTLQIQTP